MTIYNIIPKYIIFSVLAGISLSFIVYYFFFNFNFNLYPDDNLVNIYPHLIHLLQ